MTTAAEILKREESRAKREKLELELKLQLTIKRCTKGMLREFRFRPDRKWRFDFAWPELDLAVEVEGISNAIGRHQRPGGYAADCEKYNAAALHGWVVLRYTGAMVYSGKASEEIFIAINDRWRLAGREVVASTFYPERAR